MFRNCLGVYSPVIDLFPDGHLVFTANGFPWWVILFLFVYAKGHWFTSSDHVVFKALLLHSFSRKSVLITYRRMGYGTSYDS